MFVIRAVPIMPLLPLTVQQCVRMTNWSTAPNINYTQSKYTQSTPTLNYPGKRHYHQRITDT